MSNNVIAGVNLIQGQQRKLFRITSTNQFGNEVKDWLDSQEEEFQDKENNDAYYKLENILDSNNKTPTLEQRNDITIAEETVKDNNDQDNASEDERELPVNNNVTHNNATTKPHSINVGQLDMENMRINHLHQTRRDSQ